MIYLVNIQLQTMVNRRCTEKGIMQAPGALPSFIDLCLGKFLVYVYFTTFLWIFLP